MDAKTQFAALVETMLAQGEATFGNDPQQGARKMFGSTSIKTEGKMFAFLNKEQLVVKLPASRVDQLVSVGAAARFDPGNGRLQKEWAVVMSESPDEWLALATEAEAFVGKRGSS